MLNNAKALLVVLSISWLVFLCSKSICLQFMTERSFLIRRNSWYFLTIAGFLAPSFWLYALVAAPAMYLAGKKDENPAALYIILIFSVQPDNFLLPEIFGSQLFALNNSRVAAIFILIPYVLHIRKNLARNSANALFWPDVALIGYFVLTLVVAFPYESITAVGRRALTSGIDTLLIYYVFSRSVVSKKALEEVLAVFCLVAAVLAIIGLFETGKTWQLYGEISQTWGASETFAYLFRDGSLRARASTGHALSLGIICACAFGFWLHIGRYQSNIKYYAGMAVFWAGMIAAYSRSPWLSAVICLIIYLFLMPKGVTHTAKALFALFGFGGALLLTPYGTKIIDSLPFVGTLDSANVDYRQRLAVRSIELISDSPWFGDALFIEKMEDLRQGQGIIDLVNAYTTVALNTGLVGATLLFLPMVVAAMSGVFLCKKKSLTDKELSRLLASITACFIAYLFYIGASGMDPRTYVWVGLIYGALVYVKRETQLARDWYVK